jgi:hypothetical protein
MPLSTAQGKKIPVPSKFIFLFYWHFLRRGDFVSGIPLPNSMPLDCPGYHFSGCGLRIQAAHNSRRNYNTDPVLPLLRQLFFLRTFWRQTLKLQRSPASFACTAWLVNTILRELEYGTDLREIRPLLARWTGQIDPSYPLPKRRKLADYPQEAAVAAHLPLVWKRQVESLNGHANFTREDFFAA